MINSYRIIPDKQLDNGTLPELFQELHNYKTVWERKKWHEEIRLLPVLKPNNIGWEIYISRSNISFYFTSTNENDASLVTKSLPKSTIKEELLDIEELNRHKGYFDAKEMELKYHYFLSLSTNKKELEPIASILDIQKVLKDDDYAIVQYIFCPESYDWSASCIEAYEKFKGGQMPTQMRIDKKELFMGGTRVLANIALGAGELAQEILLGGPDKVERFRVTDSNVARILKDSPLTHATLEKPKNNAYIATIRLLARSDREERKEQIMRGLTVSFNTIRQDNYLVGKKVDLNDKYIAKILNREPSNSFVKNILATDEVAKLCLLPQVTLQNTYTMDTIETREVSIPDVLKNGDIPLGKAYKNGLLNRIYWENEYDIITEPKVITGGMGSGKTKYASLFVAYVAKVGHSAIAFDFIKNCEFTKEIERHVDKNKLVIFDLSDIRGGFSFAYNEIKITKKMDRLEKIKSASDLADQTAYLINSLNDGEIQSLTPKMIRILNSACMVTYSTGKIRIYDVINVLQNHTARHKVIDEAIKQKIYTKDDFKILDLLSLDEVDKKDKKGKVIGTNESRIENIMDRINVLLRNPYLEMMLMSEPNPNVNFIDYMNQGKIVLIRMPESAFKKKWVKDVLVTYFMSRVWLATLMRSTDKKPRIVHLVTDEIHQVPTAAKLVAETITEGRKFGVDYFFTCQFLKQFKELLEGVEGAGASYMLLAGTHKKNFIALKEECGEFTLEELMKMKKFDSFNIVQTSEGVKTFISELPAPLEV